jgi:hypothetical protein
MRSARTITLLLCTVLLSGCLTRRVNNVMNSWMGHNYSQLLMSWGPPQGVYDDGQGGRILMYTVARQWTTPGQVSTTTTGRATIYDNMIWGEAQSISTITPAQTSGYTAWRMFAIDKNGRIYNYSWKGL